MLVVYSGQAADRFGTNLYELEDGRVVAGTLICEEDHLEKYNWPDKVVLGILQRIVQENFTRGLGII